MANAVNNSNLFYSIIPLSANVTQSDFFANTGVITIINNQAVFTVRANVDAGYVDETGEAFRLQLRQTSPTGNIFFTTSANVTIVDTNKLYNAISLLESANPSFEESQVTFTFVGHNIPVGTVLHYTTSGNATVSPSTGSFVLNSISNTIVLTTSAVPSLQSREFSVQIRKDSTSGEILKTSNSVIVLDSNFAYTSATGGIELNVGDGYKTHIFATSGNLVISSLGAQYNTFDYLVVAGGGGGGAGGGPNNLGGSGGGAGGMIQGAGNIIIASSGSYNVIVGAGGAGVVNGATNVNSNGANSSIGPIIAVGGGAGQSGQDTYYGRPGGSGGGDGFSSGEGGFGIVGQGFPGGSYPGSFVRNSGGGGGAGGRGWANRGSPSPGGGSNVNGGIGLASNIPIPASYGTPGPLPTGRYFAGGGGGGYSPAEGGQPHPGIGGAGGGGDRGSDPGDVNTGGGGGGSIGGGTGGTGGSGFVIIRYPYNITIYSNLLITSASNVIGTTGNLSLTLNALNANAKTLYYTTEGNVTSADFIGGNTGSFVGNVSGAVFSLKANAIIPAGEQRKFAVQIREGSSTGEIKLTSANVTMGNYSDLFVFATGGNVYTVGGYRTHVFTTSDSLIVTGAPASAPTVEVLVIGGGGGGGGAVPRSFNTPSSPYTYGGGGGGAGGVYYRSNLVVTAQTYSFVIGAGGGAGVEDRGTTGSPTTAFGVTANGGGGGGGDPTGQAYSGGSGGGGGGYPGTNRGTSNLADGAGWSKYGNQGGNGDGPYGSGGGGGAGGTGRNAYTFPGNAYPGSGGDGGAGISMQMLNGTPIGFGPQRYIAAGGQGGEGGSSSYGGPGTLTYGGAVGGAGRSWGGTNQAQAGMQNHGGGGGGGVGAGGAASGTGLPGLGGSGIVIIRYPYV
jgi:hypothetical protein